VTTIADVARPAGRGTTTVIKALAGRKYVSDATRQRICAAIEALDYQSSAAGRMLRTGVTRVLGVVTPPADALPYSCGTARPRSQASKWVKNAGIVAGPRAYVLTGWPFADSATAAWSRTARAPRR
jgi:hypothetical protein